MSSEKLESDKAEVHRDRGVTMESFAHLDERKVLRKMDLRLIPMLALLYLLSFLDRGNIGNAKIEGLTEVIRTADSLKGVEARSYMPWTVS